MQPGEGEVAVSPESMAAHAGTIEAIADEVDTARAAAELVRLDSGAYGVVCAFAPTYLNGLSDELMAGLNGAVASLHDTSARIRAVASGLTAADTGAQQAIGTDE